MRQLFEIPMVEDKTLWLALCDIPGVGRKTALRICKEVGLLPNSKWGSLATKEQRSIQTWMEAALEGEQALGRDFLRQRYKERKAKISLGSYQGIRLRQGLPVRGQRTHSNARTSRRLRKA